MAAPKTEKRRQRRLKVNLPVRLRAGSETGDARTRDLSVAGMFLYSDVPLEPGSRLEIVLMLPKEIGVLSTQMVCCHATVLRVEGRGPDGKHGIAAVIDRFAAMPVI